MGFRKIKLTIESNLDDVPLIGIAVNRFCAYAAFSESDAFNIELCVIEAVTNSIKHAYAEKSGQEVMVTFTLSDEEAVFEICDKGTPMDPGRLKKADLDDSDAEKYSIDTILESGRGLGIMKKIMDNVEYQSKGECNCLILKKKISE